MLEPLRTQLAEYLAAAQQARAEGRHHDYRRHLLLQFLDRAFPGRADEVDIEKHVKGVRLQGYIDLLFRDLVFEFKRDLAAERDAGRQELTKYLQSLHGEARAFGVLTDGIVFEVYALRDSALEPLGQPVDLARLAEEDPDAALLWLDAFLFSQKDLVPTSEDVVTRFGAASAVFFSSFERLRDMHTRVAGERETLVRFDEWGKLLAKVYGSRDVGTTDVFIRHTYLSLLAKVFAYAALFRGRPRTSGDLLGIVDGRLFRLEGFPNLVESDFFAWVAAVDVRDDALAILRGLIRHLEVYDLSQASEDLLKELYQELVDPETRHYLGEYYTPDWLAELTLREAGYRGARRVLDPACGSGTFLFVAIRIAREAGKHGSALVKYATSNVMGLDVHPLAVTIARANYALALARDLHTHKGPVHIPVYMADSLLREQARQNWEPIEVTVRLKTVNDRGRPRSARESFYIPAAMARPGSQLDQVVDEMCEFARGEGDKDELQKGFCERLGHLGVKEEWVAFWVQNLKLMIDLVREGRDTIWGFILRNAYRPIYFSQTRFDFVAGNPPWLAYRYIEDRGYQADVKSLTFSYGLLKPADQKLFTVMDTSTLFYEFCFDRYLTPRGTLAFVMPKSILTGAKQHELFRSLGFTKAVDLENVSPLFNVPACVLVSRPGGRLARDIPLLEVEGNLPQRNMSWEDARRFLRRRRGTYSPPVAGARSPYYGSMRAGASIYPRCFWFVRPAARSALGVVDPAKPYLVTDEETHRDAKKPWKGMTFEGPVEGDFVYTTLLGRNLLPFGFTELELVVLPILPSASGAGAEILTQRMAIVRGYSGLAAWLKAVSDAWERHRKPGTERTVYESLDHLGKLSHQVFRGCYKVLWNKSGTHIASCVLDATGRLDTKRLRVQGFAAEMVTYYYETNSAEEAHYLCAILNAPSTNQRIKVHQTRGQWGERDITRLPFEVIPFPPYDPRQRVHRRLAAISRQCHHKVAKLGGQTGRGSVGQRRQEIRAMLSKELAEVDELIAELLGDAS